MQVHVYSNNILTIVYTITSTKGGLNWYNTMADGKSIEDDDDDDGDGGIIGLHSLLSHTIEDWSVIYHYIQRQRNSEKARERYYKNESPLQLALRARERIKEVEGEIGRINVLRALVDSDPKSICSRDNEGKCYISALSCPSDVFPKLIELLCFTIKAALLSILLALLVDRGTFCSG